MAIFSPFSPKSKKIIRQKEKTLGSKWHAG
jgi:hypothetical protein